MTFSGARGFGSLFAGRGCRIGLVAVGGRTWGAAALAAVAVWMGAFVAPAASAQAPVLSSFSPASGRVGTSVTVTGSDFTGTRRVSFGGGHASFKRASASQITSTMPASAVTGPISFTNASGTGASSQRFTVNASVSLSPSAGPPTTTVRVSGAGFGASEAVDLYFDTSDEVLTTTNATGNFGPIAVQVPASALPGTHWITAKTEGAPGPAAQAAFTVRTDWAQFRFANRHKGYNPYENVLNPSTVPGLDIDWTAPVRSHVYSSPAVAGGVVYVGSADRDLFAFPASCAGDATCTPLWHSSSSGGGSTEVSSSPAVANGIVYIGSTDSNLYAFPASCGTGDATCTPLWHATAAGQIHSSPAVANGVVYVGSDDGNLYAFPASCGTGDHSCTPLWHATTAGAIHSSPAVANGVVYVGSDDQSVYAFPASCGTGDPSCTPLWHATIGGRIRSAPAVANGVMYVASTDGDLYAFPARCGTGNASCTPRWHAVTGHAVESSPAVANGVVYIGSDDRNLYAFPASCGIGDATCAPLWHATTAGLIRSSPAVANGVVYVGSDDGNLYAFPASCGTGDANCAPLWQGTTGGSIRSSPAVANGVVYVGSGDDNLYAFDLTTAPLAPKRPIVKGLHPNYALRPHR